MEMQHTWLPKRKREQIAALLQQGVTRENFLEDIRESAINEADEFTRQHLIEKKDVDDITRSFGLDQVRKHENDQESVKAWIIGLDKTLFITAKVCNLQLPNLACKVIL